MVQASHGYPCDVFCLEVLAVAAWDHTDLEKIGLPYVRRYDILCKYQRLTKGGSRKTCYGRVHQAWIF